MPKVESLSEAEFHAVWGLIVASAQTAQLVDEETVLKLLNTISISHAIGPIMLPTEYRDGGINNLHNQEIVAKGFLAFRRAIQEIRNSI